MQLESFLEEKYQKLTEIAPFGFSAAFQIKFARPSVWKSAYPESWMEEYHRENLFLCDPTVAWGITNQGSTRWSSIGIPDPFKVMERARKHGLHYGALISIGPLRARSLIGLASDIREFTDEEIADATKIATEIHDALGKRKPLQEIHRETLEYFAWGYSYDEICVELNISRTALKSRLAGARKRLGANSNVDAVRIASQQNLIRPNPHAGSSK
jgi:LuxR family transcriptional regulator, quorum-sensing system regulator SdiA